MIKIRAEVNEIKNRKAIEKIGQTKSCFFKKLNKIDKLLARLTKEKRPRSTKLKQTNKQEIRKAEYFSPLDKQLLRSVQAHTRNMLMIGAPALISSTTSLITSWVSGDTEISW